MAYPKPAYPQPPHNQFSNATKQVPAGPTSGHSVSKHGTTSKPHAVPALFPGAAPFPGAADWATPMRNAAPGTSPATKMTGPIGAPQPSMTRGTGPLKSQMPSAKNLATLKKLGA